MKFLSRGSGYTLFLTPTEAVLTLQKGRVAGANERGASRLQDNQSAADRQGSGPAVVRMKLVGGNTAPHLAGVDELSGNSNYFIGNDPAQWRANISHYAKVKYQAVYPGVDLVYYGNQQQLEYDFVVSPGADPSRIQLAFEGAQEMRLDERGDLLLRVGEGEIRQHRPVVYQEVAGVRKEIAGRYVMKGKQHVGFEVGSYDASQPLVIDPVLVYSTYLGGSDFDQGNGIAVDSAGHAYVTGLTFSDFPTTPGAVQPIDPDAGNQDAFVTKISNGRAGGGDDDDDDDDDDDTDHDHSD